MKILAFVDLHGSMKVLKEIKKKALGNKVDLIVCAGDITVFETNIQKVLLEINNIGLPVLMIHGNHESEQLMETLCKKHKNIKFLHKRWHMINEFLFFGYGGGGFSIVDNHFEQIAKEFKKIVTKNKKIIVVTHAPPYGTEVDLIIDSHCGNKNIRKFIKDVDAILAICGHLHENSGVDYQMGKTRLINPGPNGKIIDL